MPTYQYTSKQTSSIVFDGQTNPTKLTITGINGKITSANTIAKGIRGLMYLGGVAYFNEYDPTEAIQNIQKGFREA